MRLLLSALAAAGIALSVQAAPPLELLAPRAGSVLEGGRETTIEWSSTTLPEHVDEWEAFLSLDGGKYYAIRITPHLDSGKRSFRWRVPNVAASGARLLIRVGDERDERAIEFPQTFRIVPGAVRIELASTDLLSTESRGESALPAAPPIVEWVSGDRNGAGIVTYHHGERAALDACCVPAGDDAVSAANLSSPFSVSASGRTSLVIAGSTRSAGVGCDVRRARPLLLLARRLNI